MKRIKNGFEKYFAKLAAWSTLGLLASLAFAKESSLQGVVYSVYRGLDLGDGVSGAEKDYFINLGSRDGLQVGQSVEVIRKLPTYDLQTEKLYKDLKFPFAKLKLIHVEAEASIGRLEVIYSPDKTPILSPKAVIVGDLVRMR